LGEGDKDDDEEEEDGEEEDEDKDPSYVPDEPEISSAERESSRSRRKGRPR